MQTFRTCVCVRMCQGISHIERAPRNRVCNTHKRNPPGIGLCVCVCAIQSGAFGKVQICVLSLLECVDNIDTPQSREGCGHNPDKYTTHTKTTAGKSCQINATLDRAPQNLKG